MLVKHDWRAIVMRAWSIRFIVGAGLLSGLEAALPLAHAFGWLEWMPAGVFAALSFLTVAGAFIARLLVQKNL